MHAFQPVKFEDIETGLYRFGGDNWMLITSAKDAKVNTMTASWGGVGCIWNKRCAFIFVRKSKYTKDFLDKSGSFSLAFLDQKKYHREMKYLGSVSGRSEDKISSARLNVGYDENIPYIDEANIVILCKILYHQELEEGGFVMPQMVQEFYEKGDYHTMYVAEMTKVMIR